MIINEIVNRIIFQQHIYITRYFAVLLTASTGVASLGPLLSRDGFHRHWSFHGKHMACKYRLL